MLPNQDYEFWAWAFEWDGPKLDVICTHTHGPDRRHCSFEESDEFCYPFIHKLSGKGMVVCYSNRAHKYQGVTKIAFRDQGKPWATVTDMGCGTHTYFILGDDPRILEFLDSKEYKRLVSSITFSHRQINYKSLRYIPMETVYSAEL